MQRARAPRLTPRIVVLLLALTTLSLNIQPARSSDIGPLTVTIEAGTIKGFAADRTATRMFLGIPYADTTAGRNRWREPAPLKPWRGVRLALTHPSNCAQAGSGSEDCLGLDVVVPRAPASDLPVYVFIHGGGYIGGNAQQDEMSTFVEKTGVIAVTMTYRLHALGYLDLPGMGYGAGAFGMLDQLAALQWVHRNIARFGGDPHRVTLAGQSAGGSSTCAILASPRSRGLLQAAVMESPASGTKSGSCNTPRPRSLARQQSLDFASAMGCRDVSMVLRCMQSKSAADISLYGAAGTIWWVPETGTSLQPLVPTEAFASGRWDRVPVIIGSNFRDAPGVPCGVNALLPSLSKWVPTYQFEFADHTAPPLPGQENDGPGAKHSTEILYLYRFNDKDPAYWTAGNASLADLMKRYWGNFVGTHSPGSAGGVRWPAWSVQQHQTMRFDVDGPRVATDFAVRQGCFLPAGTTG